MIIRPDKKPTEIDISIPGSEALPKRQVLPSAEFRFEIAKEISRSNRLTPPREFAVVRFPALNRGRNDAELKEPAVAIFNRIRISDTLGWLGDELAILLPETDREGAMSLANQLGREPFPGSLLDSEIAIYPWDDELVMNAVEFRSAGSPETTRSNEIVDHPLPEKNETESDSVRCAVDDSTLSRFSPTPWWKRAIDILGAGSGLLLLSPVFLVAALAIKLTSRGPIFYVQPREGKDGRIFGILKFRTMIKDADSMQHLLRDRSERDGPAFKIKDDPRVTPLGRYLRKSCIDELPQLINVLVGEMSLVGPRPLPVHESFGCKAWQRARLTVLPGLTCTWQVRGNRDTKFDDWMRMDLEYIHHRSFWFDLKLIGQTALLAILHRGSV